MYLLIVRFQTCSVNSVRDFLYVCMLGFLMCNHTKYTHTSGRLTTVSLTWYLMNQHFYNLITVRVALLLDWNGKLYETLIHHMKKVMLGAQVLGVWAHIKKSIHKHMHTLVQLCIIFIVYVYFLVCVCVYTHYTYAPTVYSNKYIRQHRRTY